jgi:hypothetical protein
VGAGLLAGARPAAAARRCAPLLLRRRRRAWPWGRSAPPAAAPAVPRPRTLLFHRVEGAVDQAVELGLVVGGHEGLQEQGVVLGVGGAVGEGGGGGDGGGGGARARARDSPQAPGARRWHARQCSHQPPACAPAAPRRRRTRSWRRGGAAPRAGAGAARGARRALRCAPLSAARAWPCAPVALLRAALRAQRGTRSPWRPFSGLRVRLARPAGVAGFGK